MRQRLIAFALMAMAGCSIDYHLNSNIENLPCDQGKCVAGYYCREGICKRGGFIKIDQYCQVDGECESNTKCLKPQIENCQDEINCKLLRTRGDQKAKCRQICEIGNNENPCPTGQRCINDAANQNGVCFEGICDRDEDCGQNNKLPNKCIDKSNGPQSGICGLACNPLKCAQGVCKDCPDAIAACEPMPDFRAFLCVPKGAALAFEPCDNETIFCAAGNFCYQKQCAPYCNTTVAESGCVSKTECRALYAGLEPGICITPLPQATIP